MSNYARLFLIVMLQPMSVGCLSTNLRINTVKQSLTATDIAHQEVVNNLALFVCHSQTTPSFAYPTAGANAVNDTYSVGTTPTFRVGTLTPWPVNFGANRVHQQNWTLKPVTESERLARLRCAFQIVVGAFDPCSMVLNGGGCPKCVEELAKLNLLPALPEKPVEPDEPIQLERPLLTSGIMAEVDSALTLLIKNDTFAQDQTEYHKKYAQYLVDEALYQRKLEIYCSKLQPTLDCNFPRCWFQATNSRFKIPKCAIYIGHCDNTYVWVDQDGIDALARFTLTTLKIAATDPAAKPAAAPTEVTFEYDGQNHLQSTKVKKTGNVSTLPDSLTLDAKSLQKLLQTKSSGSQAPQPLQRDNNSGDAFIRSQIQLSQ